MQDSRITFNGTIVPLNYMKTGSSSSSSSSSSLANQCFESQPSLEDSARLDHPVLCSLDFATICRARSSSLASNPQPGGAGPRIYVPQWQGDPAIPPGTGFPFRRLVRLARLRWRYSKPPPRWDENRTLRTKWYATTRETVRKVWNMDETRDKHKVLMSCEWNCGERH
jgi:hypothetical protein